MLLYSPRRNDGVSPVIGTILLVALTVTFVAVVAFVMAGLSNGMSNAKDVGLLIDTYTTDDPVPEHGVAVTVMGGRDAGYITELRLSLSDPSLYYKLKGNTYVPDPATGISYRYFADTGTYLKPYGDTWVMTNELNNTGVLEDRLVTVTGKFLDGTEQVLLIKKITIPSMSGIAQQFDYTYTRVLTFTNTTGVPGHGLLVTPINDSVNGITSIQLFAQDSEGDDVSITLSTPHQYENEYFFYLATGDGVLNTPYPTHPNADRLRGTAAISVRLKDGTSATESVPVDIPARINFFEDSSIVSGTFETAVKKGIGYTVPLTITTNNLNGVDRMYYCINSGGEHHKPHTWESTSLNSYYDLGSSDDNGINLAEYPGGTIDVFVRAKQGTTSVWYRIASASVSSLLPPSP